MNYDITFQNKTVQTVGSACKEWCLEQHYVFFHNEVLQSLWLLAVPMFALFVYWALTSCDDDVFNQFSSACNTYPYRMKRIVALIPILVWLMLVMYILYMIFGVIK